MADIPEAQSTPKKDPFQLAIPVAERVELLDVILVTCQAERGGSLAFQKREFTLSTGVSKLGFHKNAKLDRLFLSPTFTAKLKDDTKPESEPSVSVTAKFVLAYSVKSFDGIDNEHIQAFAALNGVFNAWPYWREFVQTTSARMGLPRPITIPVLRLGENPFEDFSTDGVSSEDLGEP